MDRADDRISDNIEVVPVVVVSQTFPARPSSIPDIRDFVRRCLAQSPLSEEDTREVGETVSQALLEAAGPTGAISVSFRIFPDHVEVDVLRSGPQFPSAPGIDALTSLLRSRESRERQERRPGARRRGAPRYRIRRRGGRGRQRPGALGVVRRMDDRRAAQGRPHDRVRGEPAGRLGEDRQPLGRRQHRAAAA